MLDLMCILVALTVLLFDNVVLCCFNNCILFLAYVFCNSKFIIARLAYLLFLGCKAP